ncbi:sugar-binding protein, partial [Bacteroidota bacterium]
FNAVDGDTIWLGIITLVTINESEDTNFVDKPEVTFYYTSQPINIDGNNNDAPWQEVLPTKNSGYTNITDPDIEESDLSFRFKGAWDETGIYLITEVTDDNLVRHLQEEYQGCNRWETDNVEFYFNPSGKRSVEPQGNNYVHSTQCRINTGDEELDTLLLNGRFKGQWNDIQDPDGSIFKYMISYPSGGYITECWISWDAILPDTIYGVPVDGLPKRWGFSVLVCDSDDPEIKRDAIALWSGAGLTDNHWQDVNYFGVLHLSDIGIFPEIDLNEIYFYMQEEFQYMGSDKTIDFGKIDVNSDSTITIIIYNNGSVSFNSLVDINGEGFELVNTNSSLNIEPGSSEPISIKFTPEDIDQYTAELVLYANDETFFTIGLTGIGGEYMDIKNSNEDNTVNIHPNPVHDFISINAPIAGEYKVEIYDMLGRKLLSMQCMNNEKINISALNKGSYLIKLYRKNISFTKSLIIK